MGEIFSKLLCNFTINISKDMLDEKKKNTIFSPFALFLIVIDIMMAAKGESLREMEFAIYK